LRAGTECFVGGYVTPVDSEVERGQALIRCEDPLLRSRARVLAARRQELEALHAAQWRDDRVAARVTLEEIRAVEGDLAKGLRYWLKRSGFADPLVGGALALVREVAGRRLGMRHFDLRLVGGWAMLSEMIAEMETGEGKTLTATLPACTAALAGIPVHVISVNDYLARRDAAWMRPIYEALGLRSRAQICRTIAEPCVAIRIWQPSKYPTRLPE
jgi:hypothetical protein